jgi:hypothetical protein
MDGPPDKIFRSGTIPLTEGVALRTVSDWEAIGAGRHLILDGQLVLSADDLDVDVLLNDLSPTIFAEFPVGLQFYNTTDGQIDVGSVPVELIHGDGNVQSSKTVELPALGPGEQYETTVNLAADQLGTHTVQATTPAGDDDRELEITDINFELGINANETVGVGASLFEYTVRVDNQDSYQAPAVDTTVEVTGPDGGRISGRLVEVPSLNSGDTYSSDLTLNTDDLQIGSHTIEAVLEKPDPLGSQTTQHTFEVEPVEGVKLVVGLEASNVDISGGSLPAWHYVGDSLSVENQGSEDATNVEYTITVYRNGEPLSMHWNTGSFDTVASGEQMTTQNDLAHAEFSERGEHTVEVAVNADQLSGPVVGQATMNLVDDPGEARLNVQPLELADGSSSEDYQFDATVEEESGDATEGLEVTAVVTDANDTVVFEETKTNLSSLDLNSTTVSFNAGTLDAGDYNVEVTADATNATEPATASEPLTITSPSSDKLAVSISATDTSFGGQTDVTAFVENVMAQEATSVTADVVYYNQNGEQIEEPETFTLGSIASGVTETVEHTQPISECWRLEMNCIPGVSNGTGEYTAEIQVDLDQSTSTITKSATFQVT